MLIEMQMSRSTKSEPRNAKTTPRTLVIPAMVAALLMAVALTGCSAASGSLDRRTSSALLIHNQAVGQDNGNLTNSFVVPRRAERPVYVAATPRLVIARY
jgi:hypothetical protein